MLIDTFSDCDLGVYIQFRTDGKLFNLRRLQAKSRVFEELLIREFLFADDCALAANTHVDMQCIMDRFATACRRFGLTISLGKTECMFQEAPSCFKAPTNNHCCIICIHLCVGTPRNWKVHIAMLFVYIMCEDTLQLIVHIAVLFVYIMCEDTLQHLETAHCFVICIYFCVRTPCTVQ